jgi:two-component system cell cycle sensor histidine kinase/response regulator CckA
VERLRVLIVEDSSDDAALVLRALRLADRTVEFEQVQTTASMREALRDRGPWDVVTSDWSMPDFSALGALELLKEMRISIPFIVVSGTIRDDAGVRAMRAGAHDYVLKHKLDRLAPAIDREIREHHVRRAGREAELRFKRLCDSGAVGIMVTNVADVVVDANDALLEMIGYTRDEMRAGAMNMLEITVPDLRTASVAAKTALPTADKVPPIEKAYLRKNGTHVPALVSVLPLDSSHFLAVVTDLTERKRTEAALASLEEQLRQAQKMEAVGRLAGGIAHDFNNLLSVILSYTELLLLDLGDRDPMREDIEQIHRAGERAAALTRQILTFSRRRFVAPKVIDLNTVLADMDKILRRTIGEDVELTLLAASAIGLVRVDPSSIEQVVMNLAVNARDAMPTGGKLTIETSNIELEERYAGGQLGTSPGPYVVLSVTDTGTGMDRATLDRIFEPFFTTKETGKGTGLGLSTVFGIAKQGGGDVKVHSQPGVGTTFKVYLPRADAVVEVDRVRPPSPTVRGSETILLAEDDDQVREAVRNILRRHGYVVLEARNAGEALLISESHDGPIDLLVTDVVMPVMSGPTLARRLARARPQMKVLCMSGYADDVAVRHGVIEAAFTYLQKPITVESLTRKVREVLESDHGGLASGG